MPITRINARDLLRADSVSFHSTFDPGTEEWTGHITAHRRDPNIGDGYTDTRFDIDVDAVRMERYHRDWDAARYSPRDYTLTCSTVLMFCGFDARQRTIVRAMAREGHKIGLRWTRNNQSPVLNEVGFRRDTLDVAVENRRGIVQTFRADEYVGPDNTARMTRFVRAY